MTKQSILNKLDKMTGYQSKLEYLNDLYLKAKTAKQEDMIMDMIEQLQYWGR